MKKLLIFVFTLNLFVGIAVSETNDINSVKILFAEDKYPEAIVAAQNTLSLSSITEETRNELMHIVGYCYFEQHNYEQSLLMFKTITDYFPNSKYKGNSEIMVAKCYNKMNNPLMAIKSYNNVIHEFPGENRSFEARKEISLNYFILKNNDKAQYISLTSDNTLRTVLSENLLFYGNIALNKNDLAQSRLCFDEICTAFPDSKEMSQAILLKAKIFVKEGQLIKAAEYYSDLLSFYPESNCSNEARRDLADLYFSAKTTENCDIQKYCGKVLPESLKITGEAIYYKKKNYKKAMIYFKEVVEKYKEYPFSDDCLMMLARCYKKNGEYELSMQTYNKILSDYSYNNHSNEAQTEILNLLNLQGIGGEQLRFEAEKLNQYPHPRGRRMAMRSIVYSYINENRKQEAIKWLDNEIRNHPNLDYEKEYLDELASLKSGR